MSQVGGNQEGGRFELFLDGMLIDSHTIGAIAGGGAIVRGNLAGSSLVTPGLHEVRVQLTRNFAPVFGLD
jgi:hypothetical protein